MKPGEKIKKLRNEKNMTQSELAGNFITRNMLSLIESGTAQPSLSTIVYLAERLNVPPGILVSDDKDDYFYKRISAVETIRKAYRNKDYRICLDLCNSLGNNDQDSEIILLKSECLLEIAKEEFFDGHLKKAIDSFDLACENARSTFYSTGHIMSQAYIYCDYIKNISQSLYADCNDIDVVLGLSDADPFCRYAKVLNVLPLNKWDIVNEYLSDSNEVNNIYIVHVKAKMAMSKKDHAEARRLLLSLLNSSESVATPVMYDLFKDLEECCRDSGDFKGAYEYSGAKVGMLERMVSEDS